MNKYVLVTAMILFAAISNTDAQNNQVKDFKMVEEGGSGPYKALVIADTAFEDFTVYRPNDLQAAVRAEGKLPIIIFGNGGCIDSSVGFEKFLNEIASYGYVAVAVGPFSRMTPEEAFTGKGGTSETSALIRAMDIIQEQATTQGTDYYNLVDVKKIVAMGQSCGGLQALTVSVDPRISTSVILNSGVFAGDISRPQGENSEEFMKNLSSENQERMMSHRHEAGTAKDSEHRQWHGQRGDNPRKQEENSMANTLSKDGLQKLHAPLVYLIGGKDDIAYPNASDDFNRLSQVPVAMANLPVGHMGTYNEDHGGEFAKVALLWLDWQLKGKGKGKSFFLGTEADRSAYPGWTVETKNF